MHGSMRGIKAIHDKLWQIEAVDLKFTSTLHSYCAKSVPAFIKLRSAQSFSTSGSGVSAILG
jgi:hypothetical protein